MCIRDRHDILQVPISLPPFVEVRDLAFVTCYYSPDYSRKRNMKRTVLITGASSGIGASLAKLFAQKDFRLIINARNTSRLNELKEALGGNKDVVVIPADLSEKKGAEKLIQEVENKGLHVDILVNNAGIAIGGSIVTLALEDWQRQQAINLDGVFLGIKHCIPPMIEAEAGSIVNLSSVAGIKGAASLSAYNATKGGVRLLTKGVALECANNRWPIRVNSVHPGIIDTPIWDKMNPEVFQGGANIIDREEMAELSVPTGQLGYPLDIANGVLFLASDESRYMTGTELIIDGGLCA